MFKNKVILLSMACYAVTGGSICMKGLVGGKWKSHGDCNENQEQFKSIVDEIRAMAENGMTTKSMMTSDISVTSESEVTQETTEAAVTSPGRDWNRTGDTFFKCFNNVTMTYRAAEAVCKEYGGGLAAKVLRDPTAASFIAENCVEGKQRPWVGYDDIAEEGEWIWSDGGATNNETTPWKKGEPNNDGNEDCAHITKKEGAKLLLNDMECNDKTTYICEV